MALGFPFPGPVGAGRKSAGLLQALQYYLKRSALAHPTSPNLSAPRASTLMSQSAVGLDMVNPGCITAPERIL